MLTNYELQISKVNTGKHGHCYTSNTYKSFQVKSSQIITLQFLTSNFREHEIPILKGQHCSQSFLREV